MDLFCTLFKIGLFTFGGGYAMIPLIQREAVERKRWVSDQDMLDMVAIAESTPGPIAINSATFIGNSVGGASGAFFATLGVVLPSFIIIVALSFALEAFSRFKGVQYAFWGIRAGVLALIVKAAYSLFKQCKKDWFSYGIMALAFIAVALFKLNSIIMIAAAALLGIAVSFLCRSKAKNGEAGR